MVSHNHSQCPRGTFVVLEGIDGSGKDTLAQTTSEKLNDLGYVSTLIEKQWACPESQFVFEQMQKLKELLFARTEDHSLLEMNPHYWMLLAGAWFTALYWNAIDTPLKNGSIVITNGWYFKLMARFTIKGCDTQWMKQVFSRIPSPDIVVLLDVEPAKTWNRRRQFSEIELGYLDGYRGDPKTTFIAYQQRVREILLELSAGLGWHRIQDEDRLGTSSVIQETNLIAELVMNTHLS